MKRPLFICMCMTARVVRYVLVPRLSCLVQHQEASGSGAIGVSHVGGRCS